MHRATALVTAVSLALGAAVPAHAEDAALRKELAALICNYLPRILATGTYLASPISMKRTRVADRSANPKKQ